MSEELSESRLEVVNGGRGQRYYYHTVVHGDSLSMIACYYNTTEQDIQDMNPIIVERFIRAGWVLKVPDNR